MTYGIMKQSDANDIVMYLTTMQLNCRPQHDCTFGFLVYTPHLVIVLLGTKFSNITIINEYLAIDIGGNESE